MALGKTDEERVSNDTYMSLMMAWHTQVLKAEKAIGDCKSLAKAQLDDDIAKHKSDVTALGDRAVTSLVQDVHTIAEDLTTHFTACKFPHEAEADDPADWDEWVGKQEAAWLGYVSGNGMVKQYVSLDLAIIKLRKGTEVWKSPRPDDITLGTLRVDQMQALSFTIKAVRAINKLLADGENVAKLKRYARARTHALEKAECVTWKSMVPQRLKDKLVEMIA